MKNPKLPYSQMSFWQLGTVQHCLSAQKKVWSFSDSVLVILNIHEDEYDSILTVDYTL